MHRYDNCGLIQDGKVITFRPAEGFDGNIIIPDDVTEIGKTNRGRGFCLLRRITGS